MSPLYSYDETTKVEILNYIEAKYAKVLFTKPCSFWEIAILAEEKISTAIKVLKFLEKEDIIFTEEDWKYLGKGRLGRIVSERIPALSEQLEEKNENSQFCAIM